MLSAEKLPPDPPCPPPQLIKDLDLSNQTLLDDDNSNSPLPKFSIRDYVFTARSKDLKTSWPFSQENLQRCLRHGVKEVLPPFQSLDSVRNQPSKIRCTVEDENRSTLNIAAPSGHVDHDHAVLDSSNNAELKETRLAEACTDTTTVSCRSEGDNDFPSTVTSISQSEIEESVPINRPLSSAIETDTSLEAASFEVKAAGPPIVSKIGRTTRPPPGKKCRLVVKYKNHSDRNSKEDISSNCSTISETMTSKVCPVCKTFSSSSNTTLNAHIDQCLSGESTTPKWTAEESKVTTRHRIKPRKTKMMVDIYVNAQHCTLEDLDRRNGSSWATTVSSFPTNHDKEKSDRMPAEVKRQRVSSVYPEPEDIDVGAVYVDASGTKVRILSKFDDKLSPPASKVVEHLQPIKPLKGGKGGKFFPAKKKKHNKYLKLAPQSRNLFSSKAHSSEFHEDEESYGVKESCKEGRHRLEKLVNPYNPLALRPWACSKRTGVGKKLHQKDDHQVVKSSWNKSCNLLDERNQTFLPVEGFCVRNFSATISSPERSSSTEDELSDSEASDKSDCSPQRKRAGSPTSEAGMSDNIERACKRNSRQFSNHSKFSHDRDYEPMFINTAVGTAASPSEGYGSPPDARAQPSKGHGASRSNSMKFHSSKKVASSVGGQLSATENDAAFVKKISAGKKSQVHKRSEIDRDDVDWDSEDDRGYDFMYNCAGKQSRRRDNTNEESPHRSTVLPVRRNRSSISNSRREPMASESSQLAPEHSGYDERADMDTSGTVGDELVAKGDDFGLVQKEDQILGDDTITESSSLIGVGKKTVTRFCNPVDPELNVPGRHSKAKSSCFQYKGSLSETKALTGPTEPRINNEQDMFCVDEGEDGTVGHSAEEMDSEVGQGSYFAEVDPIPIPGPPGSFLPSPRDMGSDEFQGNSSLTTSRVQSSQDQLDLVDGDTSDSPISTTSTISHSTGTYRDRKFSEPLSSKGSQCVQEKILSGVSSGAASDASVETNAAALQQITGDLAERHTFDRESFRVNKISLERGPLGYKSKDDQPCCCQRKERNSEVLALNYQESPLLRRRAMASVIPATTGKQMGCSNTRTNNAEISSDTTETFFSNGCPTSRPEQMSIPVVKSPYVPVPLKGSPDGKGKFSSHSDSGSSVSPSASNSILRLMGKNLMVVNRDEDASAVPPGQVKLNTQVNHITSQFPTFSSGVSPGSLQNQVRPSFQHTQAHGSVIVGQDPYNQMGECFDGMPSMSFRSYINPIMPPVLARGPPSLFPKQHSDGGVFASMEPQEYKGGYNFPIPLHKPASKPIGASTFHKNANSASSGDKEIIVIDDCEADHLNAVNYDRLRESQAASSGILIPATSSYNSKRPNPPLYQSPEQPSLLCGSPVLYNTSFHAIPSRRANASPVGWNCTTDGSGMLQRGPFHATSTPSRGIHMRSTLYNPPSLS